MTAMAYGLTGTNLYMAVGRDRWIGGAIDERGRARASAERWRRLLHAFHELRIWTLSRRVPVRIVRPRCLRHLARATHVFDAVPPSAFALTGQGVEHACLETVAGMSPSPALACERFARALEAELDARGIPFAITDEDLLDEALERAAWTIVICPGALPPVVTERLARAVMGSVPVSVGPLMPERDAGFRATAARLPVPDNARAPVLLPEGGAALRDAIDLTIRALDLRPTIVRPPEVFATLFEDAAGAPRVAFVINPTETRRRASVVLGGALRVQDALTGEVLPIDSGVVSLDVPGRTVVLLELDSREQDAAPAELSTG
jgi:beta-galactosidase